MLVLTIDEVATMIAAQGPNPPQTHLQAREYIQGHIARMRSANFAIGRNIPDHPPELGTIEVHDDDGETD